VGASEMLCEARIPQRLERGAPVSAVVKTRRGEVRGSIADGVNAFRGIPYAAPPFGANRFRAPQPVEPWSGVREARTFGPEAPQLRPDDPQIQALVPDPAVPGEDCLNLNIWSADLGSARQPVMVWIPGGMFEVGSGASYDGSHFARDGIVCVTMNYRVGADGFLYLGDGNANLGLLDQVAAFEWVQENIAAFGGDPDNVTIFGQSAGAMSVGTLLSMPRAEGLFRRAIAQSGAAHHVISAATARRVGQHLAQKLGVEATREAIAAVPVDRLLRAQAKLKADLVTHPDRERWGREVVNTLLPWQPVVDGDVIPAPPLDRIAAGASAGVDVMVGTNTDEHRVFLVPGGALDKVTAEALAGAVAAYGLPVDATLTAYRVAYPRAGAGDLLAALQTDWYWRIPAIRLADARAKSVSATYMYEFAWRSPEFNGLFGACHALEIAFVFDTLDQRFTPMLGPVLGTNPPQRLADTMHAAWVAFATNGDCGWPKYDLSRRATMRFDTTSEVVNDPRSAERALWEGVR
jgi:para-nitrobenzyl esterase